MTCLGYGGVQAQLRLSPRPLGSEQTLYLHVVAGRELSDIPGIDAQRFALDQNGHHCLHDVKPLAVAMRDEGSERLLRYDIRENHVLAGIMEGWT